jgi:hypothetical protein
MRLMENVRASNASATIYMMNVAHDILTGVTGLPKTASVYSASTFKTTEYSGTSVGVQLGAVDSGELTSRSMIAIESGTNDLDAVALGSRIVFLSWFYSLGTITWTADAQTIVTNSVAWLLGGAPPTPGGIRNPVKGPMGMRTPV